jgi:hypothetical protein
MIETRLSDRRAEKQRWADEEERETEEAMRVIRQ